MIFDLAIVLLAALAAALPAGLAAVHVAFGPRPGRGAVLLALPLGLAIWTLLEEGLRALGAGGSPLWSTLLLAVVGTVVAWWAQALSHVRQLRGAVVAYVAVYAYLLVPLWAQAGRLTVLGFGRSNDSVFVTVLAQRLLDGQEPAPPRSVTAAYDFYPLGGMDLIAAGAQLIGGTAFEAYMPMLALFAAALVFPAMWLLDRLGVPAKWTPLLAPVAAVGMLQVNYYVQGAAGSVFMAPLVLAGMTLFWQAWERPRILAGLTAGLVAGAAVTVYGLAPLLWLASFAGLGAVLLLVQRGESALRPLLWLGLGGALGMALAAPGLLRAWRFARETEDELGSGVVLGNLGGALNPLLALGIDWELLPALTLPATAVAGVLFAVGLSSTLLLRCPAPMLILLACAFATIYSTVSGPYYVAKTLAVAAVPLTVLISVGAVRMARAARTRPILHRLAAGAAAAVWLAGAAYTSWYYLLDSTRTPERLEQLAALRPQLARAGETLVVTEQPQNWTAYFLRGVNVHISALEGMGGTPPPQAYAGYEAVLAPEGVRPPGRQFVQHGTVAGFDLYFRRGQG